MTDMRNISTEEVANVVTGTVEEAVLSTTRGTSTLKEIVKAGGFVGTVFLAGYGAKKLGEKVVHWFQDKKARKASEQKQAANTVTDEELQNVK